MTGLEVVGALAAAAGTVVSTVGAIQQAQSAAAAADYNAAVDRRNAASARMQASADAEDKARSDRRQLGSIRAAYGASGIDMSGSALDVLEDTASEQKLGEARILYKGDLRAQGYTDAAQLQDMTAESARSSEGISFFGGVLKTGAGLADAGVKGKWGS